MIIYMVNIHGLLRSRKIEMGRDADTGGQTRYVIDLVNALSTSNEVSRIDIFTRLIKDKCVSEDYSKQIEYVTDKCRIVRLSCGGGKYLKKEHLWPYLDEFVDRIIAFIRAEGKIPDIIHGHYADGGYVAGEIASNFGIPFIFTAHSLGYNKLAFLKSNGWSREQADKEYHINYRIEKEETILAQTDLVITSTEYERDELYGFYKNHKNPEYNVIPPGLELSRFFPYYDYEMSGQVIPERNKQVRMRMMNELQRFHIEPEKPLILALCRPDARKNIDLLIDIYGKDKELQALANLAIFAGIRDNIAEMENGEKQVLTDMLLSMDLYDLYGKMAIPKNHDSERDVPELYRIAASRHGVFVSASYLETFGLTLIEASAAGLPFVASNKGGPKDITNICQSGLLVNVEDNKEFIKTIKKIVTDQEVWQRLSDNGVNRTRKHYQWSTHCDQYLNALHKILKNREKPLYTPDTKTESIGRRLSMTKYLVISDIDDTLLGDRAALNEFRTLLQDHSKDITFGVATGRHIDSAIQILEEYDINWDIIISSVGTEIYYTKQKKFDKGWYNHLKLKWKPEKIREILKPLPILSLQTEPYTQRDYKISYNKDERIPAKDAIPIIHNVLSRAHLAYNLIFSHGSYIDILPYRASKGKAIRYLSTKWKIPLVNIFTAGNSGNDKDMLTGNIGGIIVGNHEMELESLKNSSHIYFAREHYSAGIIEGLKHYGVL
ncbi:MAG: HAD-IIB family hydrolase [Spirochaetales bacterium]|nr:HAD-IIB family hydrolase [Spirochaetales bacterium]